MESPIVKMETSESDEFIPKQDVKIEELENQTINPEIVRVKIEGEPREMEEDINSLDDLKFNISADTPFVKIKEEAETEELENPDFVCVHALKNEEVDIKSEENMDSENSSWKNLFKHTKPKIDRVSDKKCPKLITSNSAVHSCSQNKPKEYVLYSCNQCHYKTHQKKYLNRHIRGHNEGRKMNNEGRKMHKCTNCDYKTIYKNHLKVHQVVHKNIDEVSRYQCNQCGFQTVYKTNIKIHLNRHYQPKKPKQPKKPDIYKCSDCDFQTLHKMSLKQHAIRHKNVDEVCLYRCKECDYKTKIKSNLTRHNKLRHKENKDDQMYYCNDCTYKTVYKSDLKRHVFTHKKRSKSS